jgi:tetratricopeptide (TPR) repeat protein
MLPRNPKGKKRMSSRTIVILTGVLLFVPAAYAEAEADSLKLQAVEAYKAGRYPAAVSLMQQAVAESPDDAETCFRLGWYLHYLSYDSRPLSGFSLKISDQVLSHLARAVELDPSLGNARYFTGAEYGVRAREALRTGNIEKAEAEFRAGRSKGGFPDWMIEYGRNVFKACKQDAILFTGGDAETNPIEYLQLVEGYRCDVTVVPMALLDVPWFGRLLQDGLEHAVVPAPISWSDAQLASMRPYKWQACTLQMPRGSDESSAGAIMSWYVEPDLSTGEKTFLSAGKALLIDIIETNAWLRPVYFSVGIPLPQLAGLKPYLQLCGLAHELSPIEAAKPDSKRIEDVLLDPESYSNLASLKEHDMPRASRVLLNYHSVLLQLAAWHAKSGDPDKARDVLDRIAELLPGDVLLMPKPMRKMADGLRASLKRKQE